MQLYRVKEEVPQISPSIQPLYDVVILFPLYQKKKKERKLRCRETDWMGMYIVGLWVGGAVRDFKYSSPADLYIEHHSPKSVP
jgi:hypothetical protein